MLQLPTHLPGCPDAIEWVNPAVTLWASRFNDELMIGREVDHCGLALYRPTGDGGLYLEFGRTFSDDVVAQRRNEKHLQDTYPYLWGDASTRGHDLIAASCPSCSAVSVITEPKALTDRVREYLRDVLPVPSEEDTDG